jgi:hypothetical protein
MIPVRQATAFEIAVGPVLDADGVAVTNCVIGDFKLKKTTGNFAALNASATLTHVSAGVYDLVMTTSDTDTVGLAAVAIDDTVNACPIVYLQVVEEAVYDALYAASALGYVANAPVSVAQWAGTNVATPTVAGVPEVDVTHYAGATTDVSTIPASVAAILVDTAEIGTAGAGLTNINLPNQTMDIVGNITGSLSGAVGSVGTGGITRASFAADTGLQTVRSNTAQAGGASTITLDASASSTTDFYKYGLIYLTGGTGAGQAGYITGYNGTTKVATVSAAWATAPDNTTTFAIFPNGASTVAGTVDANVTQFGGAAGTFASGLPSVNLATDLYHADICFTRDQANTQDEYTVTWFKNGVRLTSGVTSPTIQVVKRADGTDLVAATAMTEVGSTETFKYDATGSSRVTQGEAVLVVVAATIDSGSRTFSRLVSRDST